MITDVHSHIIPMCIVDLIRKSGKTYGVDIKVRDGMEWVVHEQGYAYPLFPHFYDVQQKIADMTTMGIDFTILSPAPPLFMYWIEPPLAAAFARMVNEGISEFASKTPEHFLGIATVPMQDIGTALSELEYAASLSGLCGVEIGTTIEGVSLDDPQFEPFFARCEQLNWPVFLHPYYVGDKQGFQKYYLTNLVGNPLDTALAASALMFGGVLDSHPQLKVILAHAGGYLPYQIGRLDHGYSVRAESKTMSQVPSAYLTRFTYDCITFNSNALKFLIEQVGPEHVVIGTDYPFDMADLQPLDKLHAVIGMTDDKYRQIAEQTPIRLFPQLSEAGGSK